MQGMRVTPSPTECRASDQSCGDARCYADVEISAVGRETSLLPSGSLERILASEPAMRRALTALALLAFALPLAAQTGPWHDGELIVRMNPGGGFEGVLYRIDPQTGHGAMLADTTYLGTHGSAVFDNY